MAASPVEGFQVAGLHHVECRGLAEVKLTGQGGQSRHFVCNVVADAAALQLLV